jgi:hypothetical protein
MSTFGASENETAAALDLPASQLTESDRDHMRTGLLMAEGNILIQLWKKAEAGNTAALLWWSRRLEQGRRRRAGQSRIPT